MDIEENLLTIRRYESFLGKHLGPFCFANKVEQLIEASWQTIVDDALREIKKTADQPTVTFEAPSAEHAAAFLKALQIDAGYSSHRRSNSSWGSGLFLFRGMSDQSWNIESTLFRFEGVKENGRKLSSAFARLMSELGKATIEVELPEKCYEAVSQHYDFPTNLIDFTPDPEVAVYFATKKEATTQATVYFASTSSLLDKNLEVLLPPPLFTRIYLQRGVFIGSNGEVPKSFFHRVLFPAGKVLPIFRGGYQVDIQTSPSWINHAKCFIKSWALKNELDKVESVSREWFESNKRFHFSNEAPEAQIFGPSFDPSVELLRWLDQYEDMRYWLASTMKDDAEGFYPKILSAIEKSNTELVKLHKEITKRIGKPY